MHYTALLGELKQRIRAAQYEALRAVNEQLIDLYWDIGQLIVERQEGANWGRSIVEQLARDLQAEFPGLGGFSAANLWRMRRFYETYARNEKLAPMVREIGWSHNLVILEKCNDSLEREFYLRMTRRMGWTKNVLIHQIENQTYQKTLLNQTNFDRALPEPLRDQSRLAVKDEYTFDFLELADEHSERQLEQAILARVEPFLREMGGNFAFLGSQYRLAIGDSEYFIDTHALPSPAQMSGGVGVEDRGFSAGVCGQDAILPGSSRRSRAHTGENPSIGIILCKSKDKTIVEYALRESNKPIGVATYRIVTTLPTELQGQLPAPEQVAKLLEGA